jgi:hypothetical protein
VFWYLLFIVFDVFFFFVFWQCLQMCGLLLLLLAKDTPDRKERKLKEEKKEKKKKIENRNGEFSLLYVISILLYFISSWFGVLHHHMREVKTPNLKPVSMTSARA